MSGMRYGGSSRRNVDPWLLNAVMPRTFAMMMATTMPMMYIENTRFAACSGKNIAAKSAMIGSFAEHVKKGVMRIDVSLSFSESSARAPMMAGTPQPKPTISGMMPLPVRPTRRMIGSMMKATRAIYPVPSRKDSMKNSVKMSGTKLMTLPTPATIPSAINDFSHSATPADSIASLIQSVNGPPIQSPTASASG